MKILAPVTLALSFTVLPGGVALADPMQDVCHSRAVKGSGYSGPRTGLSKQAGNTTFRLSGSAAFGVSRSSGTPSANNAPGFAGSAETERREAKEESKYTRIYNDCMRSR